MPSKSKRCNLRQQEACRKSKGGGGRTPNVASSQPSSFFHCMVLILPSAPFCRLFVALCPLIADTEYSPHSESLHRSTATTMLQAPPTLLSQTASSHGPENVFVSEISEAVGGEGPEASGAGSEFSLGDGGGGAVERCEGCGRTFACGRLQSHAKVRVLCGRV